MKYFGFEHAIARAFDEGSGPDYVIVWILRVICAVIILEAFWVGPLVAMGIAVMGWAGTSFFGSIFGMAWVVWPVMMVEELSKYRSGEGSLARVKETALFGVWFFGWIPVLLAMLWWTGALNQAS